jgi:hypothetical protein
MYRVYVKNAHYVGRERSEKEMARKPAGQFTGILNWIFPRFDADDIISITLISLLIWLIPGFRAGVFSYLGGFDTVELIGIGFYITVFYVALIWIDQRILISSSLDKNSQEIAVYLATLFLGFIGISSGFATFIGWQATTLDIVAMGIAGLVFTRAIIIVIVLMQDGVALHHRFIDRESPRLVYFAAIAGVFATFVVAVSTGLRWYVFTSMALIVSAFLVAVTEKIFVRVTQKK